MGKVELRLPQMGESVAEATVTNWLKQVGDSISVDEIIVEVATDKVDNDIPSEVDGVLLEQRFKKDETVKVGEVFAVVEVEGKADAKPLKEVIEEPKKAKITIPPLPQEITENKPIEDKQTNTSKRFYSPLVKTIAKENGLSFEELESISGSGIKNRLTKDDLLGYLQNRETSKKVIPPEVSVSNVTTLDNVKKATVKTFGDEIIAMDRMRKLIASHMTESLNSSAHVQSFIEVDVHNLVIWRNKIKTEFEKREGEKLTFTPIFIEAVARTLKMFPFLNSSIEGDNVVLKKQINIGMATALPSGNLIVPVIKNADQLSLVGLAKAVNDLAKRARESKLKPDETQNGTYTITNIGNFGSIMGTPIINQPQVGILAIGAIRKTAAVVETPQGDFIAIRQRMFLSHSYDHRIVDGGMGGMFIKKIAEYLEAWDIDKKV